MATTATNVYWSKDYYTLDGRKFTQNGDGELIDCTTFSTPLLEPFNFAPKDEPHECDVIQRMSEAYRANVYA
jgi:hypothetical protein